MNKTHTAAGALLLLVIAIGGWFTLRDNLGSQGAALGNLGEPVHIGFIAPITGPFATWGESIQLGAQLAMQDTRHRFEIDFQDDACQPQQAVNAAQKFFNTADIHVVLGPGCDDGLKAIAPLAKQHNALLLSTGLLGDDVFVQNPTNVINLATQISTEAAYMAAYLHAQGVTKMAIVHGNNSFGQEYSMRMPEKLAAYGITVTINEGSALDATDFRTTAAKILQSKPEAVFIHQGEQQTGILVKQLRQINKIIPIYSYYVAESDNFLAEAGVAANGVHYTYPVNSADDTAKKADFEKRYAQEFGGRKPTATSAFVYDGVLLLDKAFDVCTPTDGACVEKFLKNHGPYEGLSGKMEIQADGKNIRPFGIKTIKDGQFVWVTKEVTL